MSMMEEIRKRIREERQLRESEACDVPGMIRQGAGQQALEKLIYFSTPAAFLRSLDGLTSELRIDAHPQGGEFDLRYLEFLTELALSLSSVTPRWNLQNSKMHGSLALSADQVRSAFETVKAAAETFAEELQPERLQTILAKWEGEAAARLKAEGVSDARAQAAAQAAALVGNSVGTYIQNMSAALSCSHLRRMVERRLDGAETSEFSNDYAAFLPYALYLGASFATTNPPLVNLAWAADPEKWDAVAARLVEQHASLEADELAKLFTLEVVLEQMLLLRPIYLLSEGEMGCVCLQVSPHKHASAEKMVDEALFYYRRLEERLQSGVPNVVFKLPGTQAGLQACRALTKRGIGVTITVNFGMFQHLPFIQAIDEGEAIFSCIVEMNGRLAFPVRDELLGKLSQLAAAGIDEAGVREAAAWAGVIVAKRLHQQVEQRSSSRRRIKPLIASLRYYQGSAYQGLPSPFPDISETFGTAIISVFPNIRRPFDLSQELVIHPQQIQAPVPQHVLEVLEHSEIFKQAFYVEGDDERLKPENPLSLSDERAAAAWAPVRDTLAEFIKAYEATAGHLSEVKARITNLQPSNFMNSGGRYGDI